MKRFLSLSLAAALALNSVLPAEAQQADSLTLLTNAASSGKKVPASGGAYQPYISGTFGGATLALIETVDGVDYSLDTFTSAPAPGSKCYNVPRGAQVQMTVTGGAPSGLTSTLGGLGFASCPGAGGSGGGTSDASAAKQDVGNNTLASILAFFGAQTDAKSNATDGTSVTFMQVTKQISSSLQAIVSALSSGITVATHAVTQSGSWVLSAGSAIIGKVDIDQTTPGTTNHVDAGVADGGSVTIGAKADSACGTDAGTCTLQGLVKRLLGSITTLNGKIDTLNGNVTSAVPTQSAANIIGGVGTVLLNGVLTTPRMCSQHVYKHITTATDTQIVAASGSTTIYVCGYSISSNGTGNIYLEKATTGTCGTLSQIDQAWYTIANWAKIIGTDFYHGLNTGASAQLCAHTDQAVSIDIGVDYDQN